MKAFFTKKILTLFTLMTLILGVKANTVIVSGYVKDVNGVAIANKAVNIYTDSISATGTSCVITRVAHTNPNGYYIDTIHCSATIQLVYTSTLNCNGVLLKNTGSPVLNPTLNTYRVESNFIICVNPPPTNCVSMFTATVNNLTVAVNSSQSTAAGNNDSIIKRDWSFGDSLSSSNYLIGNIVSPTHSYTTPGFYTVCLKITTAKGCFKTICKTIVINSTQPPNPCKASFNFIVHGKTVNFINTSNSGATAGAPQIFINSSLWKFGVNPNGISIGTSTLGNPTFTFPSNGTYLVCLKITTTANCVNDTCINVTINDTTPPPITVACKALFVSAPIPGTSLSNKTIKFNSANSYASANNDSIISRHWSFGDSLSSTNYITGNVIDPIHTFTTPGVYNVCLKITTAKGCVNTACLNIYVALNINPSNCTSFFTQQPIGYKVMKYSSNLSFAGSNDSIISRIWNFGDGSTLGGNNISPVKTYNHGGTYQVCLKVTTAKGCINNFCTPVKVIDTLNNFIATSGIKIINLYPNPTFGNINLNVRSSIIGNINALIEVYDVYNNRRILKTVTLANGNNFIQLLTQSLPQGVYLIKITSNNGMDVTRFIKL